MSLNMLGLGFSFGAKDLKLKDFQASISEGFLDMADQAAKAVDSVKPLAPSFEEFVPQIDAAADAMGDFESKAVGAINSAGDALKGGKEQWTEMKSAVTDAANEWKEEFAQVGEELRKDVAEGFERVAGAARGLAQQTGIDQVARTMSDLKDRAVESGTAIWAAAKSFMGLGAAAQAANRATTAINPDESVQGVESLDEAVKEATGTFDHDLPVAMEAASRSFHKEATRIIVDSEHMTKMFDKIKDAGDSLKKLVSLSKLQTVFQGIGTGLLAQMSRMKSGIGGLLNANVNLTTSLEAEGVQLAKSAKATAAQMGYSGKEMRKVTSEATGLASGLNIGADVAVKAIYNFNWAQEGFQALGIKTAAQAAKMAESLGMDPSALAGALRKATQQLGMTSEQAAQLTSSLHEMGKDGGVASEMVMQLGDVLESASGATDQFGNLLKGDALQRYAMGIVTAGAGLYTFTQDSKQAMDISKALARRMQETGDEWNSMMSGAGGSFPEMNQMMMRFGMNVDDTFKMMASSPEGLVRGLAQLQKGMKDSGMTQQEYMTEVGRLRPYLTKALGDKAASDLILRMGQNWEASGDAMLATMDRVRGADKDFGKLADEAHSTGRTLQEEFDRMKEAGIMGFRSIGRSAAVDFVQNSGKAFTKYTARLKELSKKDGPIGDVITKLSQMSSIGSAALLPKQLQGFATYIGTMASEVLPSLETIGALSPLAGALGPLFAGMSAPMIAVAGAAGALAIPLGLVGLRLGQLMLDGKSFGEAWDQVGKDIQGIVKSTVDYVYKTVMGIWTWMSGIDLTAVFTKMFKKLEDALTGKIDIFGMLFGGEEKLKKGEKSTADKIESLMTGIPVMLGKVKDSLLAAAERVDWGAMAVGILSKLTYVFIELPNKLIDYVLSIDFSGIGRSIMDMLSSSVSGSSLSGAGDVFKRLVVGIGKLLLAQFVLLGKLLYAGLDVLFTVDWVKLFSSMWSKVKEAFVSSGNFLADLGGYLVDWFAREVPKWVDTAIDAFGSLSRLSQELSDWVMGIFAEAKPWAKKAISDLIIEFPAWLDDAWVSVADWVSGIDWGGLAKSFLNMVMTLKSESGAVAGGLADFIGAAVTSALERIPDLVAKFKAVVIPWLRGIPQAIREFFEGPGFDIGSLLTDSTKASMNKEQGVWRQVFKSVFMELVPALWDASTSINVAIYEIMLAVRDVVLEVVWDINKAVVKAMAKLIVKAGKALLKPWTKLWDELSEPVGETLAFIDKTSSNVIKAVLKGFENLHRRVIGWFNSIRSKVGAVMDWLEGMWDTVKETWNTATEGIKVSLEKWIGWFRDIWSEVKEKAGEVGDALLGPWERVSKVMENFREKAKDFFGPFIASAVSFGQKLIGTFKGIVRRLSAFLLGVYENIAGVQDKLGVEVLSKEKIAATVKALKSVASASDAVSSSVGKAVQVTQSLVDKFPKVASMVVSADRLFIEESDKALKLIAEQEARIQDLTDAKSVKGADLTGLELKISTLERLISTNKRVAEGYRELAGSDKVENAFNQIAASSETAKDAADKMAESIENLQKEVGKAVDNSIQWDWYDAMNVMNEASDGTASRLGNLGNSLEGVKGVAEASAKTLDSMDMAPKINGVSGVDGMGDTMTTALMQPFMHGAGAADYYAKASLDAFQKVVAGAAQAQNAMGQLSPAEMDAALRLSHQLAAEPPAVDDMTARQRELQTLSQGPMREVLQATHNPQWYSDWRETFLKSQEELKEEIRKLQPTGKLRQDAKMRPMPERNVLEQYGMNYNRVGNIGNA